MNPEMANLRAATNPQQSCAACPSFQGPGSPCAQGLPADPSTVCDLFGQPMQNPMEEGMEAPAQGAAPPQADIMAQLFGGG